MASACYLPPGPFCVNGFCDEHSADKLWWLVYTVTHSKLKVKSQGPQWGKALSQVCVSQPRPYWVTGLLVGGLTDFHKDIWIILGLKSVINVACQVKTKQKKRLLWCLHSINSFHRFFPKPTWMSKQLALLLHDFWTWNSRNLLRCRDKKHSRAGEFSLFLHHWAVLAGKGTCSFFADL